MGFQLKMVIAYLFQFFHITDILLFLEHKKYKNQYIRIVNYHDSTETGIVNFEKQLLWFQKHYHNVDMEEFENFLSQGILQKSTPGIMLTFDDGLSGNYEYAKAVLEEFKMTGYFMVSADLVGTEGYMGAGQLRELLKNRHVIGCHTSTHHRMALSDSSETLEYEIVQAKKKLEQLLETEVSIFCWCGGEEHTYTQAAERMIEKAGFLYGFMTNSEPVIRETDPYHIQRINVEENWPIALVKLQICGFMDYRFRKKRKRVNVVTERVAD